MSYDPDWLAAFQQIRARVRVLLPEARIEHVGSTAVPGCDAKPILDVSVGLPRRSSLRVDVAREAGLEFRSVSPESALFAIAGPTGRRIAHVHVRGLDSPSELRDLCFRDFLRAHPQVVREYITVKRHALSEASSSEEYKRGKAPFFEEISPRVERWARTSGWSPSGPG